MKVRLPWGRMRINYVLIDLENVQPSSLAGLEAEFFHVLIFVGANQAKIAFELASAIQRLGERARYIKISGNGSNALDFHIAYYIGRLAQEDPTARAPAATHMSLTPPKSG